MGQVVCRTSDLEQHYHHVYRSVLRLLKEHPATPDHGKGRAGLTAATSVGARCARKAPAARRPPNPWGAEHVRLPAHGSSAAGTGPGRRRTRRDKISRGVPPSGR